MRVGGGGGWGVGGWGGGGWGGGGYPLRLKAAGEAGRVRGGEATNTAVHKAHRCLTDWGVSQEKDAYLCSAVVK